MEKDRSIQDVMVAGNFPHNFLRRHPWQEKLDTAIARAGLKVVEVRWLTDANAWLVVFDTHGRAVTFRITQLPGCCGVGVVSGIAEWPRDIGADLLRIAELMTRSCNYALVLATDITTSSSCEFMARDGYGWEEVTTFNNLNTDNDVVVWMKNIRNGE